MADQNYATLYEDMQESSERMRVAADAAVNVMFGPSNAPDVIVDGFAPQPTWNKRFAEIDKQMRDAIVALGYDVGNPIRTFTAGATLTRPNEVIRWNSGATESYWRWDGAYPPSGYVVAPGSSPTPAGVGYWILVGDGVLRSELVNGTAMIGDQTAADVASVTKGLKGRFIVEDTTFYVPSTETPNLVAALNYVRLFRVMPFVSVTIKLANGDHFLSESAVVNHLDGAQLKVIGNITDPSLCRIKVLNEVANGGPTFDAIVCGAGFSLGLLDGVTVELANKAGLDRNFTAVLALARASITCGNKVVTRNWYYGIAAREDAYIRCEGCEVYDAGDVGIWAYVGSTVDCAGAKVYNVSDPDNGFGYGIQAEFGSTVTCTGAEASGCYIAGIAALSGGTVRAHYANTFNNVGSGMLARDGGNMEIHGATSTGNSRYGLETLSHGSIKGGSVTMSGNTLGNVSDSVYFDNGPAGARIASNGDMRIDTNGANNIYFNTSGGVQAQIAHTANSNSWSMLRGSAANQPGVEAAGNAGSIDYNVRGKGNGRIFAASQRPNFVAISGASAGQPVTVEPEGGDNHIDMILKGKGTNGRLRWGLHTGGSVTPNGYVEWKLEDGAIVRVAGQRL